MRYFNLLLRTLLFIALLGFAIKNDQPVTLHYLFGYEWESSLVIILLLFFAAGAIVGVVAMLVNVLQLRREVARLRKEIGLQSKMVDIDNTKQIPSQSS